MTNLAATTKPLYINETEYVINVTNNYNTYL